MGKKIDHSSPSQLGKMMSCMRWWFYDYVLCLPETIGSKLIVGKAFHKSVEANLTSKINEGVLLPEEAVLDIAADNFEKESLVVQKWDDEKGKEKDRCIRTSKKHCNDLASSINPVAVERKIETVIADVNVVGYIDIVEPGRLRDTKFKSRAPNQENMSPIQRAWYSKVRKNETGEDIPFIFDVFVPKVKEITYIPVEYEYREELFKLTENELATRVKMVEYGLFPRANPETGPCSYCPHKEYCWRKDRS